MTTIQRYACFLLCLIFSLTAPLAAQGILKSFEGGTSSGAFPGASNPEGWIREGGLVRIAPYPRPPILRGTSSSRIWSVSQTEGNSTGRSCFCGSPRPQGSAWVLICDSRCCWPRHPASRGKETPPILRRERASIT